MLAVAIPHAIADHLHNLWKCPRCLTIHNVDPVDFADIYRDYPLNKRRLDVFARGTLRNLLGRLRRAGLAKEASILDYGCGNGVFIQYLKEKGYPRVEGYDPFVAPYSKNAGASVRLRCGQRCHRTRIGSPKHHPRVHPAGEARRTPLSRHSRFRAGGHEQPRSPYHEAAPAIPPCDHHPENPACAGRRDGLRACSRLSPVLYGYLDSIFQLPLPRRVQRGAGSRYGFPMLQPAAAKAMLRHPQLWFYAYFGYFFPSAFEPAVVLRRLS